MPRKPVHKWEFRARFRRHSFGWKSQPAIKRVKEAVSEIKKVARKDNVLGGEGAVLFLEKVSPALEHVDSSSGAIGVAVNRAIEVLVGIIASAPADAKIRARWLERLFEAHADDEIPYIELLAEHWGELCASAEVASEWADQLLGSTRLAFSPDEGVRGHFHGTSACLSALYAAGRHDELVTLLEHESFWSYKCWAAKALAAQGDGDAAIHLAESCQGSWGRDPQIDRFCEEVLMSSGRVDEAYEQYGLRTSHIGTYLAWFRAVARRYPHMAPGQILRDLVAETPGEEGKWFAAAKAAKLFDEAIALANSSPCAPQTLTRAARDYADENPLFAVEAGMAAIRWLLDGHGYDVTGLDVMNAHASTMKAAGRAGCREVTEQRIDSLLAGVVSGENFVAKALRQQQRRS